ncbi:MAG: hypothetical protein IPH62_16385 [Ignavibacteriae bacterium]|nr:hypothetical protein [Ignavibacteriota bacterium]
METNNNSNVYRIINGKKVQFTERVKVKHTIKLKELGFDFSNNELLNRSRLLMIQDPKVLKDVYNCIFDQDAKDEEILECEGTLIRDALDDFLKVKCGIEFKEV